MIRIFAIAGVGVFFSGLIYSQATTSAPAFEVASVKVNTSGERASADTKGDRLTMYNMPMKVIIALAYQVPNDRVTGPAWLDTDGFDIVAKHGPDTTADTLWLMLQNLLAERFKLAIHRDQSPVPVYALVVGKKGPKLQEASADSRVKSTCSREGTQLTCRNQKLSMADLAQNLPRWVSRDWFGIPVVDQTGIHGVYDFSLTWTLTNKPDESIDPPAISLFDVLQDQLGLKLEQRKVPVDRIVIDHIERVPSEN
jgi:uncharacterized protein (TIGR03435 family)